MTLIWGRCQAFQGFGHSTAVYFSLYVHVVDYMQISPPEQHFAKGIALGILTVFIGSGVAAVGKRLTAEVDISAIVLFQYLICFLLTLPWIAKNGVASLKTAHPWQHIIRGVAGCYCFYSYYVAMQYIPLVDATLLRNTAPLIVPLILFFGFSAVIPRARWLPLLIGFIGIIVMLRPAQNSANIWHLIGLTAGIGLAVSMVMTRKLAQNEPESRILFYYFFISLLFVVPFFIINYQPIPLASLPWLVGLGVAMYITFVVYTRAYAYVKTSVLAPTSYFAVVFAGLLDWIFWDHIPDGWSLAGAVLVIGGGLLIIRQGDGVQKGKLE